MPLQELAGGIWSAGPSLLVGVDLGYKLDATGKRVALIFRVEKAGQIEGVEFLPGTDLAINAASVIRVSLQNVGATGEPDGTQDEYRDMLGSSLDDALWKDSGIISSDGTDTGTKRSVSRGNLIAVVFEYQTFTAADVFSVNEARANGPKTVGMPEGPYTGTYDGATWTLNADNASAIGLRYADGTFAYLGLGAVPVLANVPINLNEGSLPDDEVGVVFRLTVEATLRAVRANVLQSAVGPIDWQFRVYNDADTQLGQSGITPAAAWGNSNAWGGVYRPLTTDVYIEANRWYRATLRALTGAISNDRITLERVQVSAIAHFDAYSGGRDYYSTRRTNNGPWTDEQTIRPTMELYFSHFADAPGGAPGGSGGAPGRGFFRGGVS